MVRATKTSGSACKQIFGECFRQHLEVRLRLAISLPWSVFLEVVLRLTLLFGSWPHPVRESSNRGPRCDWSVVIICITESCHS
jgi:hypothetical protein